MKCASCFFKKEGARFDIREGDKNIRRHWRDGEYVVIHRCIHPHIDNIITRIENDKGHWTEELDLNKIPDWCPLEDVPDE